MASAPRGRPIGFAGDPFVRESYYSDAYEAFGALGYAKGAIPMKAPLAPAPVYDIVSIWGSLSYDVEKRTGTFNNVDIGSTTRTWTAISGGDLIKTGIFHSSDAFVIGVLHSYARTKTTTNIGTTTDAYTPGNGAYAAYINGGFSADFAFTVTDSDSKATTAIGFVTTTETWSYSYTGNVNYRIDLVNSWWIEPTAGVSDTYTTINRIGFVPGYTFRVQGGTRFGTEWLAGTTRVSATRDVTGYAGRVSGRISF